MSILVPDGLVGYWPLDAANVDFTTGVVTDLSSRGNNGTLVGAWSSGAEVAGPNPWNSGALVFDGTRNITAASYDLQDGFSFCFWVNALAPSSDVIVGGAPVENGDISFAWAFIWNFPDPTVIGSFLMEDGSGNTDIQADFTFQDSFWYFVVCTWDGATMNVYIDDVLCGSVVQASPVIAPSGIFSIGKGANFFSGTQSGVRIYDRPLTADDRGILYRGGPLVPMTGPPFPRPLPGSNAIGLFQIGVSPIGTIAPFDFWSTVMAQYANSPILTGLIQNMFECIDPTEWFDDFFSIVMNLPTAEGFGLDILGRIVGVSRVLQISTVVYFGFQEATPGPVPFNAGGVFYAGGNTTTNFALVDPDYKILIMAKALANISDGSMKSINTILSSLFPGRGNAYVTNGQNMSMALVFAFTLTPVELAIIEQSGAIPIPAGVSFTVVQT